MIRLLLVDDQDDFRQDLSTLLSMEDDLVVVGEACHGREAIALTEKLHPDVLLMDVQMPICDGVTATREIHQHYPWVRILVLTTFDADEYILQALQAGALGYLLKRTSVEQMAAAIRSAHLGNSQLGATIASKVFAQLKPISTTEAIAYEQLLTKREREVLWLVGEGKNNQEIAQALHLTEGTVKNYVTRILEQLNMRDRVQAALWAQKHLLRQ